MTYDSGRVVNYTHDDAGRPNAVSGMSGGVPRQYAADVAYAAHGALASVWFSKQNATTGIVETTSYNSRLQVSGITAVKKPDNSTLLGLTLGYCLNAQGQIVSECATNNGNILRQDVNAGGTQFVQTYTYDALNRLTEATEADRDPASNVRGWTQQSGYDRYGNRFVPSQQGLPALTIETPQAVTAYAASNRISALGYDNAGNVTGIGVETFAYDGQNRVIKSTWSGTETRYTYDAEGRKTGDGKRGKRGTVTIFTFS